MADSTVTIVGNLTRDPELRFTAGGKGVASFGVAVNRRYQVNGEWQEKVSFFNVTAWDTLGENAAASLTKGTRIMVTGRLEQREYETTAGEKRNVVESSRRVLDRARRRQCRDRFSRHAAHRSRWHTGRRQPTDRVSPRRWPHQRSRVRRRRAVLTP
jgi:single stranded DNA-binding protein